MINFYEAVNSMKNHGCIVIGVFILVGCVTPFHNPCTEDLNTPESEAETLLLSPLCPREATTATFANPRKFALRVRIYNHPFDPANIPISAGHQIYVQGTRVNDAVCFCINSYYCSKSESALVPTGSTYRLGDEAEPCGIAF